MAKERQKRMVIIGGPSCVGKSPLKKALKRFYPDLMKPLEEIVLYNTRSPRPGEEDGEDYHFRSREEIEKLGKQDSFILMDVRGDLQGLDLDELAALQEKAVPFFEGNPYVARTLQTHESLSHVERLSVFMSPLSKDEVMELKEEENADLNRLVTDLMRRKLLRRAQMQKANLALPDLEDVERRAGSALKEIGEARHFQYVLPNHDGEDSDNWDAFYYPLGDARRATQAMAALLAGRPVPSWVEHWDESVLKDVKRE